MNQSKQISYGRFDQPIANCRTTKNFISLNKFIEMTGKFDYYLCYGDSDKTLSYNSWIQVNKNEIKLNPFWKDAYLLAKQIKSEEWQQWIYFYTMDCPFFRTINDVLREFKEDKIEFYSHEIKALRFALQCASKKLEYDKTNKLVLYRKFFL